MQRCSEEGTQPRAGHGWPSLSTNKGLQAAPPHKTAKNTQKDQFLYLSADLQQPPSLHHVRQAPSSNSNFTLCTHHSLPTTPPPSPETALL